MVSVNCTKHVSASCRQLQNSLNLLAYNTIVNFKNYTNVSVVSKRLRYRSAYRLLLNLLQIQNCNKLQMIVKKRLIAITLMELRIHNYVQCLTRL